MLNKFDIKKKVASLNSSKTAYKYMQLFSFIRNNHNNMLVISAARLVDGIPMLMKENEERSILVTDLKANEYELVFIHKSQDISQARKAVIVNVDFSNKYSTEHSAKVTNLNYNDDIGMFTYLGGGRWYESAFASLAKIKIKENTSFLTLTFSTQGNRVLDGYFYLISKDIMSATLINKLIDNTKFANQNENKKTVIQNKEIAIQNKEKKLTYINRLSESLKKSTTKSSVLIYANISPNVVDGSSIWLTSITNILSRLYHVILLLKEPARSDIILSNIENKNKVTIIDPTKVGDFEQIDEAQAINIIKAIDDRHPKLIAVLVRGLDASKYLVDDRVFKYRTACYLTDFYQVDKGQTKLKDIQTIQQICLQSELLLSQTSQIKDQLITISDFFLPEFAYLRPSLPDNISDFKVENRDLNYLEEVVIGYAGKIMPNWGVEELLEWTKKYNDSENYPKIRLEIVANKITAPGDQRKPFAGKILKLLDESYITHYKNLNRDSAIEKMAKVDYVWAYRPGHFENSTLELSTKLLESAGLGKRLLNYPSNIHKNELGEDYPYYIKDYGDFLDIMQSKIDNQDMLNEVSKDIIDSHSVSTMVKKLESHKLFRHRNSDITSKTICFAGHDYKFLDAYISYLKSNRVSVIKDRWEWGEPVNVEQSRTIYGQSDVIFCEWGLANAVWYSKNNEQNKPIYIRVHLQEINAKALKFGKQIDFNNIKKVIFVSERVRDEYVKLFKLPYSKTIVIPNFVLDDEYLLDDKRSVSSKVTLGMVGIVPTRKRFDRAIDLLDKLLNEGVDAYLSIKGHRPENLDFMHGPSRKKELEYYYDLYKTIDNNTQLKERISFAPWGNDVSLWYQNIDFILSPSDFESFHYAMADGILSGCIPIIWNWDEAKVIYNKDWIVDSDQEALDLVKNECKKIDISKLQENRNFIIKKYGKNQVFNQLSKEILGE